MRSNVTLSDAFVRDLADRFRHDQDGYQKALEQAKQRTGELFAMLYDRADGQIDRWPEYEARLDLLIEDANEIDWHAKGYNGMKALYAAGLSAWPKITRFLLANAHDPNLVYGLSGDMLSTPLMAALEATNHPHDFIRSRALQTVSMLLEAGADPCMPNEGTIMKLPLLITQDSQVTALLIEYGVDPMRESQSKVNRGNALHHAADCVNLEKVHVLLDAGMPIEATNYYDQTAERIAAEAQRKHREIKIDSGFEPSRKEAEKHEKDAGKICCELATRKEQATELYEHFMLNPVLADLPDHAFIYFSNINRLNDVMKPEIYTGQEREMLNHLLMLPPWLQQQQSSLIIALTSQVHAPTTARWTTRINAEPPPHIAR